MKFIRTSGAALAGILCTSAAGRAEAHALMQRYDLPVPLGLFLAGSAATVALSFVVLGLFARGIAARPAPRLTFGPAAFGGSGGHVLVRGLVGTAAVGLLVLVIAAGLFGNQDPFKNIAPVTVWVVWWVGLAYIAALIGDPWPLLNPWAALHRAGAAAWRALGRQSAAPALEYPERLGVWPAALLFLVFAWLELVWPARDRPGALAGAILAYSAIALAGMTLFGRQRWLATCDPFALVFGTLGRFAPLAPGSDGRLAMRLPAAGLLHALPAIPSMVAFVILLLSTVTFDGLLETPLWAGLAEAALAGRVLPNAAEALGVEPYTLLATLGLIGFVLTFAVAFAVFAWLMAAMVGGADGPAGATPVEMMAIFVWSLVPIAIAYHLAHYLSYFLVAGQFLIPLISDPFGWGWNLFGTTLYFIDIGVVDARFVWYASVVSIVTGHVIAVYIAHVQALRRFGAAGLALRSQYPMLVLMVAYTAISLWILAQPVTEPAAG